MLQPYVNGNDPVEVEVLVQEEERITVDLEALGQKTGIEGRDTSAGKGYLTLFGSYQK